ALADPGRRGRARPAAGGRAGEQLGLSLAGDRRKDRLVQAGAAPPFLTARRAAVFDRASRRLGTGRAPAELSGDGKGPQLRPARRARSTTGPMTSITRRTSASVEVWPRVKRSEPRAEAASAPMASRTCEGWATPAEHADPVEHSTPLRSEEHTSELQSRENLVCRLLLEKKNKRL